MENAMKNSGELIDKLTIIYNRARQVSAAVAFLPNSHWRSSFSCRQVIYTSHHLPCARSPTLG